MVALVMPVRSSITRANAWAPNGRLLSLDRGCPILPVSPHFAPPGPLLSFLLESVICYWLQLCKSVDRRMGSCRWQPYPPGLLGSRRQGSFAGESGGAARTHDASQNTFDMVRTRGTQPSALQNIFWCPDKSASIIAENPTPPTRISNCRRTHVRAEISCYASA